MSGRTVTDAEPLRERALFVYDLNLLVDHFPGKSGRSQHAPNSVAHLRRQNHSEGL